MIPNTVTTIGPDAFLNTKLTGLELSKATSLVRIGDRALVGTGLAGRPTLGNRQLRDHSLSQFDSIA